MCVVMGLSGLDEFTFGGEAQMVQTVVHVGRATELVDKLLSRVG